MLEMGRNLGTVAVLIHPWSQANFLFVAQNVTAVSRQYGLATMLGLGVTTLDQMRESSTSRVTFVAAAGRSPRSATPPCAQGLRRTPWRSQG